MKIRVKNRKTFLRYVWGFVTFVFLIVAILAGIKLSPLIKDFIAKITPKKVAVTAIIRGDSLSERAAEDAIKKYFEDYYTELGLLSEEVDLSKHFLTEDTTGYQYSAIENAVLNYMIACRKMYPEGVYFYDVTYGIKFTDSSADNDGILTVKLYLDEAINFSHVPGNTSYSANIAHTFTMKRQNNDTYKIISHTSEGLLDTFISNYNSLLDSERTYTAEEILTLANQTRDSLLDRANTNITKYYSDLAALNANPASFIYDDAANLYDRAAAVTYANMWVGETTVVRNSSRWGVYDTLGGNCANYVSQCMFAGGIPMDMTGNDIWKWYSDVPDDTNSAVGRCPSWTAVGSLYNYCVNNEGYGLSATVGGNFYSGQPGDLIIMGTGKDYTHVVIICDVIKDADGNVIDYLINSNTADRKNYPIAVYGTNNMRLIHINGWND